MATEKMTRILLPQSRSPGLMEWGEQTAETMISSYRRHAAYLRAQAEAIESATDDEFKIDVVRGSLVQRHVAEVQRSTRPSTSTERAS